MAQCVENADGNDTVPISSCSGECLRSIEVLLL